MIKNKRFLNAAWGPVGGSKGGPPPGFLVGGPNESYVPPSTTEAVPYSYLANRPPQKRYADFNTDNTKSYQLTENAIYYQAAYVRLLSKFVGNVYQVQQ